MPSGSELAGSVKLPRSNAEEIFPATRRQSMLMGSGRMTPFDTVGGPIESSREGSDPGISSHPQKESVQQLMAAEEPRTGPQSTSMIQPSGHAKNIRTPSPPSLGSLTSSSTTASNLAQQSPAKPWDPVSSLDAPIGSGSRLGGIQPSLTPTRSMLRDQSFWTPGGAGDESFMTAQSDTSVRTLRSPAKDLAGAAAGLCASDSPARTPEIDSGPSARRIEAMLMAETPAPHRILPKSRDVSLTGDEAHLPSTLGRVATESAPDAITEPTLSPTQIQADPATLAALVAESLLPQIADALQSQSASVPHRNQSSETLTRAIGEMREFLMHMDSEAIEREQRIATMLMEVSRAPARPLGCLAKQILL